MKIWWRFPSEQDWRESHLNKLDEEVLALKHSLYLPIHTQIIYTHAKPYTDSDADNGGGGSDEPTTMGMVSKQIEIDTPKTVEMHNMYESVGLTNTTGIDPTTKPKRNSSRSSSRVSRNSTSSRN